MKRIFTFGLLLLLWVAYPVITQAEKGATVPNIVIATETWDFGTIEAGQVVEHVFVMENTGMAALAINSTTSSCSCTLALLSTKTVPTGGKGEIRVRVNSKGKAGQFKAVVMVASNDPDEPVKRLKIVGMIKAHPLETR